MEKNKPLETIEELKEKIDKDMEEIFGKKTINTLGKLKLEGSDHYKSEGLQPFDVYKILPCEGFSPFMIFCTFNILKYIWRICNGSKTIDKDIGKITHYAETFKQLRKENLDETQKENCEA